LSSAAAEHNDPKERILKQHAIPFSVDAFQAEHNDPKERILKLFGVMATATGVTLSTTIRKSGY